jgi:hypothetical protein
MGLEVYYPTDVRNALLAAEQAVNATADATGSKDDPFTAGFLTGYRAALVTLALAFGLTRPESQSGTQDVNAWRPVVEVLPGSNRRG